MQNLNQARQMIQDADALLIGAGAGMGVDLGLPKLWGGVPIGIRGLSFLFAKQSLCLKKSYPNMNSTERIMQKIHTFQKYSQRENWVTNNTLLFLSRINTISHSKFKKILYSLFENQNIEVVPGINFYQQESSKKSVFDGTIHQPEFKIAIETKLNDNFDLNQLKNHISGLAEEKKENRILLALSKNKLSAQINIEIHKHIKLTDAKVHFSTLSFLDLIESVKVFTKDYEIEIYDLIEEYENFCNDNHLIPDTNERMLTVTVNTSIKENLKYGIYYDPTTRNHNSSFKYLALYLNKSIIAFGEVIKEVHADLINDEIVVKNNIQIADDEKMRIKNIINDSDYYDIRTGHKFYLVKKFVETNFRKTSHGSLRGKKYFNIQDLCGENDLSIESIAEKLNQITWE